MALSEPKMISFSTFVGRTVTIIPDTLGLRSLKRKLRIEFSPDGIRWVDSGLDFALPTQTDELSWISVNQFGNWLRVAVDLPPEAAITVLVSIHLKA